MARNPAPWVAFPAPATSNAACGFPATNVIEHICRGKTAHRVRREGTADRRFLPLSFGGTATDGQPQSGSALRSNLSLLRQLQRIVDRNAKISDDASSSVGPREQ